MPAPIARIGAFRAQLVQRAIAAFHHLAQPLVDAAGVIFLVDVVDQENVDAVGAEALQAVLERAASTPS